MRVLLVLTTVLLLVGCSSKPVRHLASDAALIQPGTPRTAVLQYLGEPDGHRWVSPTVEEFVYYEDQKRAFFSQVPLIGDWIPPKGYEMILLTLEGEKVSSCEFRTFNEDDQDWRDDFTWEDEQ
ncbi:MAG: hypothetical protein CSA21_05470 [Deltaproteobacteria bacterium]|nr:MAG: hypothetical protein CSA21_05470 [Deltaproteobacteria bacterium]